MHEAYKYIPGKRRTQRGGAYEAYECVLCLLRIGSDC